MRQRRGKRRRAAIAIAGLGAAMISLMTSVPAGATDSDLKHAFAFRVEGSNGYSIVALAANERADGRGQIVLFVSRGNAGAIYAAPAALTATSVEADLGSLGGLSLDVIPSEKEKKFRSSCADETVAFEPQLFRGNFEFHGEEGYTDAMTDAPREYTRFFVRLLCAGAGSGELTGPDLPGARLRLHARRGAFRLNLQASKNRPHAPTRFEVGTHEKRAGIAISRSRTLWVGADAFDYDPLLRSATLEPPAPFSGRAELNSGAVAANRWTGNLTVDLPGRSDVPLTGGGVGATLTHAG